MRAEAQESVHAAIAQNARCNLHVLVIEPQRNGHEKSLHLFQTDVMQARVLFAVCSPALTDCQWLMSRLSV